MLTLSPEQVAAGRRDVGITFCFAQVFHPAMRHAAGPTPRDRHPDLVQLPGSADEPRSAGRAGDRLRRPAMAPVMAEVFADRGASALVFRGDDGLDELDGVDHVVGVARP